MLIFQAFEDSSRPAKVALHAVREATTDGFHHLTNVSQHLDILGQNVHRLDLIAPDRFNVIGHCPDVHPRGSSITRNARAVIGKNAINIPTALSIRPNVS
jgi:hypothetical protein